MAEESRAARIVALDDFRKAHRRAALEMVMARLLGQSAELLPYEEVRRKLRATASTDRGLQEIPIDAIIGSVGRYTDFTRSFLPKQSEDRDRWAGVKVATTRMQGLPPIEVYQLGETYFVKDGNHRVSIARELGASYIQAYVIEVKTKVPLTPDVKPDDLILKAEYADFLETTQLDRLRPKADLAVTAPGKYQVLIEHIDTHHYFMGLDERRDIPYAEAVTHWYDHVYLAAITPLRELNLLRDFPDRTEADLYLWLADHRAELEDLLGWDVKPEVVAKNLAARERARHRNPLARVAEQLFGIKSEEAPPPPSPGQWREIRAVRAPSDSFFYNILVAIDGTDQGWRAVDQAIEVARRERGQVLGLHVVATGAHKETAEVLDIEAQFRQRCEAVGVPGTFTLDCGDPFASIVSRARWVDLLVLNLNRGRDTDQDSGLTAGFHTLLQRSIVPTMVVPRRATPFEGALLAYDGSPKAEEALFLATYLTARWEALPLTVLTVPPPGGNGEVIDRAHSYLDEHGVAATYLTPPPGPIGPTLLLQAEASNSDLIIMGGYQHATLDAAPMSVVNQVLRACQRIVLVCK